MPQKILIVDDDRKILDVVRKFLGKEGFAAVVADSGSDALLLVKDSQPDLILVDAEMPDLGGHAVCRVLKKEAATRSLPVVIMSGSRIDEADIMEGLEGGADDYVAKPFSLGVLAARIRAVLRRYEAKSAAPEALRKAGIELDPAGRAVKSGGRTLSLTRKEFDLLAALLSKAGRVLSVPYLLETVWGYDPADYNDPGTVEVHVSHLRKKLGPRAARRIVTLPGLGYKFEA